MKHCFIRPTAHLTASLACLTLLAMPAFSGLLTFDSTVGAQHSATSGTITQGGSYVTTLGMPSASVRAHSQDNEPGATGDLYYTVQVLGGNFGDYVPLSIDGYLWTEASAGDDNTVISTTALLAVSAANGQSQINSIVHCGNVLRSAGDCADSTWQGTMSFFTWVGYDVNIHINASAFIFHSHTAATADAYADPYVYIDPTFAATHSQYSLVFSEGVGNAVISSATPEPATFVLTLTALAALGFLIRRQNLSRPGSFNRGSCLASAISPAPLT